MASRVVPALQRAALVTGFGGPAKFEDFLKLVTDKPVPSPEPGEVLVRMTARAVNPADGLAAMGLYPGFAPASALPATLGLEGMGEVAAVGAHVDKLNVGQRVVPLLGCGYTQRGEGSWQEYVAVHEEHIVALPDEVSDEVGAQLVVNPATAVGMLRELDVPPGEYLLQTQAGGALGRQVISLAKAQGIRTINVVRRRATAEELTALGADEVICSEDEDVTKRVLAMTSSRGAYAALDSVAGDLTGKVISATRPGGTVLLFGGASSPKLKANISDFIFRGVTLRGFWLNTFLGNMKSSGERQLFFSEVLDFIKSGCLTPVGGRSYDLSEFGTALKAQQEVGRQGKLILIG